MDKVVDIFKNLPERTLPDGKRVKLNYEKIINRPEWKRLQPRYKAWVAKNRYKMFHVKYDEYHNNKPTIVTFTEDDTWLFEISDLLVYDSKTRKYSEVS